MAVVGFDDMPWATSLRPPLTAVAQPAEELGGVAAQLLLERLQDRHRLVRQVILPTRLMVRASCGAHAAPQVEAPAILESQKFNGESNPTSPPRAAAPVADASRPPGPAHPGEKKRERR
jgi:hypothetical protein